MDPAHLSSSGLSEASVSSGTGVLHCLSRGLYLCLLPRATQNGLAEQTSILPCPWSPVSPQLLLLHTEQLFTWQGLSVKTRLLRGSPRHEKVPSHLPVGGRGWNKKVPRKTLPQTLGEASQLLKSGERLSALIIGLTDFLKITYFSFMILSLQAVFTIRICRNRGPVPGTRCSHSLS